MNNIKQFFISNLGALIKRPSSTKLNTNGIKPGITMDEAKKYLKKAPIGVFNYSGTSTTEIWTFERNENLNLQKDITFENGKVVRYSNLTPDVAIVAIPD
jgi:hypothetical protein